jgi:hypothetical protein
VTPPETPDIRDNSFFIEEAYNQEAGVVQHIFTAAWSSFRQAGRTDDTWVLTFTQEFPVPNQTHQLSYTVPFAWLRGDQEHEEGPGDVLLNYRWQAMVETDSSPAFAPRLSLSLPTGDPDTGLGRGRLGYQVNLPLSKKIGERFFVHLNAGVTLTPGVRRDLEGGGSSDRELLVDYRFGFSLIYILRNDLNVLLEVFPTRLEEIETLTGSKEEKREIIVSPGVRYALNFREAQAVFGVAAPIGLTSETDDFGVFLYLSFEHRLWGWGAEGK